jgi:hypothetical protein
MLRLDVRYHRKEMRKVRDKLDSEECLELRNTINMKPTKGPQPETLPVDDGNSYRVVATVSLQDGVISFENTKPTTEQFINNNKSKRINKGDVLLAMDGKGSIGKTAVFNGDYDAVPDSHIAILRPKSGFDPHLISCFLNSSLGQAQFQLFTSGSTGQTQVSVHDVKRIRIPKNIINKSSIISSSYEQILEEYKPLSEKIEREICSFSTSISSSILSENIHNDNAEDIYEKWTDKEFLYSMLSTLTPDMF